MLSNFLYTPRRAKAVQVDFWRFDITAAKTQSPLPIDDSSAYTGFDAADFTQAIINSHLGTSGEFTAAQFDATAMGNDAQGILIDMGGQCEELVLVKAHCYSGTAGATLVEREFKSSSTLTDSTLQSEAAVGSSGNIGIKIAWGNTPDFDALTAGQVIIEVHWRAK